MNIRTNNKESKSFWERAAMAEKFKEDGLWGLRSSSGDTILKPIYDQIEFCADFIYAHYDNRHTIFYKKGWSTDCIDREDDYRFYENGKIGLRNTDGSISFPAEYDEIIDWGEDCNVVYVRKGIEFHYYNHQLNEILTDVEAIPEDKYPLVPYNIGEDQNRGVLLCIEPIEKAECERDCFAYNQWVRLSRIPYSSVRNIFNCCKVIEMPKEAIYHFEDEGTYIYSARVCTSRGYLPLSNCIEKFKSLGCYDASWNYLIKINVNRKTNIDPHDFYNVIRYFESDLEGEVIDYKISADYDDALEDGEVRMLQIHYFWDDMGAFLHDPFIQNTIPTGSVAEIRRELESFSLLKRKKVVRRSFRWIKYSETRTWDNTKEVLEFLKEEGADDFSMLISHNIEINPYWMEKITPAVWKFKERIITWALENGGQLNQIHNGKTLFEHYLEDLDAAKECKDEGHEFQESVRHADTFAKWLKNKGAITAKEQRAKIEAKLDSLCSKEVLAIAYKV